MVRMVAAGAAFLGMLAQAAPAQEAEDPLAAALSRNPDRLAARLVDLVAGFGGPTGLTLAGIEEHIALDRAAARATAMRRLLAMDLDGDGAVAAAELAVVQRAAGAEARGRLARQFAAADGDGDGAVDRGEITAAGRAEGLRVLDEGEADLLRAVLRLDADGDGAVTAAEVSEGIARMTGDD